MARIVVLKPEAEIIGVWFVETTALDVAQSQYALSAGGSGDIYVAVHHAFQRPKR